VDITESIVVLEVDIFRDVLNAQLVRGNGSRYLEA